LCFHFVLFSIGGALKVRTAASLSSASAKLSPQKKHCEAKVNRHAYLCCKQTHLTRAANGYTQQKAEHAKFFWERNR
jgi:hypothetical protein